MNLNTISQRNLSLGNTGAQRKSFMYHGASYARLVIFLISSLFHSFLVHAESYTLNVGESTTIRQSAYNGGSIDNVGPADYIDPHLSFQKNYDGSATITVNSYFNYTATVKLVFIERYQSYYSGRQHTMAATYYRDVSIKCNYQNPDPSKKPTKVILPERIRVPINENVYVTPILEPNGAKGTDFNWGRTFHTGTFAARPTTDGRYWLTGRSIGYGKIYVVVDDDWDNLYASAIVEVVDPNNLPPNSIFLPNEIEISVDGHSTLTPILVPENSAASFTWKSSDENIATVAYGKVTGKNVGSATITVKTNFNLQATCTVKVVSSNGKDDEEEGGDNHSGSVGGYEYVDLGLSVKWATCNVGATSPEQTGRFFAWGETNEKSTYTWSTYKYCDGTFWNVYDIGSNISGTSYDAAYVNWGKDWRMPTEAEAGELFSKCTFVKTNRNGVDGYLATGPNGCSIFFPGTGIMKTNSEGTACILWTSNRGSSEYGKALRVDENPTIPTLMRFYGMQVRAVTTAKGDSPIEPTSITLPSSKSIKVGESFTMSYTLEPVNATTTLTWTSDDSSIATVSSSGVVTGVKAGSTWINVETSNGKRAYCKVTVNADEIEPTSITLPSSKTIEVGESFTMSYTLEPANATTTLTWTSDDSSIAAVSSSGVVTGVKAGSTWINVETSNGKRDYCKVTVNADEIEPTSITLPSSKTIEVGESFTMSYTLEPANATTSLTWTSDDSSIATVSSSGVVTGVKAGSTWINVETSNGKMDYCKVTVYTNDYEWHDGDTFTALTEEGVEMKFGVISAKDKTCQVEEHAISSSITGKLTIPHSIHGLTVTRIYSQAFSDCSGLTAISIPNSVTSIGMQAFFGCSGLTSITIPNGVTSIDFEAFFRCYSLTSVTLPNSVTNIGNEAFRYCSGLTSITLPNSVTNIGNEAFEHCSGLTSIAIPENVTDIGDWAFFGCSSLVSVNIGNSVTSIGGRAFSDCSGLTSITVESGNPKYDSRDNCNAIIETSNTTLIAGCKNTVIPNSVTSIESYAFDGCSGLTSVTIPNNVASIGYSAFSGCSSLTSITIPESVTNIESTAFYGTPWLNNQADGLIYAGKVAYEYKGTMPAYTSIVIKDGIKAITGGAFYNCSGLTSITIPNSVTSIGDCTFYNCSGLTSITIPEGVTSIGNLAFSGCTNLKDVFCYAQKVPETTIYTFDYSSLETISITLHVPATSFDAYKSTEPWCYFKNIVPIDEVTSRDVTLSNAGYATFYDSQAAYLLPSDVKACVVTTASDDKLTYEELTGGVVPKGVAVMLKNEQLKGGTFTLIRMEDDTRYTGENLLCGSDETTMTSADGDCYFYKLAYGTKNSNLADVFGWYWGNAGGASFMIEGHKAWLAIPKEQARKIRAFSIDGTATAIADLEGNKTESADNAIYYDMQGRRISQPTRNGVYICNGKKVAFIK